MARGISLANKVQLLFGVAVVVIVTAALIVPWFRVATIVDQSQWETSRQIARLWSSSPLIDPRFARIFAPSDEAQALERDLDIRYYPISEWEQSEFPPGFLASAKRRLSPVDDEQEPSLEHTEAIWREDARIYRYARVIQEADKTRSGVLVVSRRSEEAANQLFVNRVFLLASGIAAGLLAVLVFSLITKRIILSPVRSLRDTADLVRQGNLHVRSDIRTGDEFEQLSEAFNSMLEDLAEQQAQLRGINRSLDLKLTELAERNVELYEAARLKDEFLASVSHELRTPLNSIIGFAEILLDIARHDLESEGGGSSPRMIDPEQSAKRKRYLDHIVSAGRSLLEMINEMLTMARLEAGNVDLHVQEVGIAAACEGLMALIKPLADRKHLRLVLQLQNVSGSGFSPDPADAGLPVITTDPRKFEQIIFNFLSNAVKFTPERGEVTLRAERLADQHGEQRVRVSVLDTGPGIPADKQKEVFEKFTQLETGHTGKSQGTGLGLAIAKQFAELLQGEIQLVSQPGNGSMFSLILPISLDVDRARRTALKMGGRATRDEAAVGSGAD